MSCVCVFVVDGFWTEEFMVVQSSYHGGRGGLSGGGYEVEVGFDGLEFLPPVLD